MISYLVCFRCWSGFSKPFPFERFDDLSDEALPANLDTYARELLRDAETRTRVKDDGKQRRKDFDTRIKWHSAKGSLPSRRVRKSLRQERWKRVRRTDRDTPLVCRIGAYLGWWQMGIVGHPLPTQRAWLIESPDREYVEQLSNELQKRPKLDFREHQIEFDTNPRFTIVSSDSLTKGELGSARRCINLLQAGKDPPVPLARLALEIGTRALQVAQQLAKSWPVTASDTADIEETAASARQHNDNDSMTKVGRSGGRNPKYPEVHEYFKKNRKASREDAEKHIRSKFKSKGKQWQDNAVASIPRTLKHVRRKHNGEQSSC